MAKPIITNLPEEFSVIKGLLPNGRQFASWYNNYFTTGTIVADHLYNAVPRYVKIILFIGKLSV